MNLKLKFKYSEIQKWMLQAGRGEKFDENYGVICSLTEL